MLFLISILCNFVFNIPIDLGYLGISLGLKQRKRNVSFKSSSGYRSESDNEQNREAEPIRNNRNEEDKISIADLKTVLNICSKALNTPRGNCDENQELTSEPSSNNDAGTSTGETLDANSHNCVDIRKRNIETTVDESGDAH